MAGQVHHGNDDDLIRLDPEQNTEWEYLGQAYISFSASG
jgi:hypothetical protein